MSYDLGLKDQVTGEWLELDEPHQMKGGTYQLGGSDTAELNITYNYGKHLYRVLGEEGIRSLYGKTGAETAPVLEKAISALADDVDDNYWEPTEGNVKRALLQCLTLARLRPDGVWDGD